MASVLMSVERYENKYREFKSSFSPTLLKVVSAFANQHDGSIYIGISDKGQVIGLSDLETEALRIENAINDNIHPRPYYELIRRDIEGHQVLEIKVFCGENQPYMYKGIAYSRKDTASVPADREELKRLTMRGKKLQFDTEIIEEEHILEFNALERRLNQQLGVEAVDDNVLRTLGFLRENHYTHAALLVSDHPTMENATIQLVRFEGSNVAQIFDHKILANMSVLEQYDACMEFFNKHRIIQGRIDVAYRETIEDVPFIAYREAVANLIVHRDYMHPASARIEIYDDRIEVMSPGGLPPGISESEYLSGNVSIPRNELLANLFYRLGMIEKLATGIKRIKTAYQGREKPPAFIIRDNSITIVLSKEGALMERRVPLIPITPSLFLV